MKRWKLFLIIFAIVLTIYNVLPTLFYYSKPLKKEVSPKKSEKIITSSLQRVNSLEKDSVDFIKSYSNFLKTPTSSIKITPQSPDQIIVTFKTKKDALKFSKHFKRAGALIPFVPAQLSLAKTEDENFKKIIIKRKIPIHFDLKNTEKYFKYSPLLDSQNNPTPFYKEIVFDRVSKLATAMGGVNKNFIKLQAIVENPSSPISQSLIFSIAHDILATEKVLKKNKTATLRYFSTFTQGFSNEKENLITSFINAISNLRSKMNLEKINLKKEKKEDLLKLLTTKENILIKVENILKKEKTKFSSGQVPLSYDFAYKTLEEKFNKNKKFTTLNLENKNPIIEKISIDWHNNKILLTPYKDLKNLFKKESLDQIIINNIADISRITDEKISPEKFSFSIKLNNLENAKSFAALKLNEIAKLQTLQIKNTIEKNWDPTHEEFLSQNYPLYDYSTYLTLPQHKKELCLVIFTPSLHLKSTPYGFKENSIYIVAKGLNRIFQKYKDKNSNIAKKFFQDFNSLKTLLKEHGYIGYPGSYLNISSEFSKDFIFEKDNYYNTVLKATRENFNVYGSKKFAILEFSDIEQRILTLNKIETSIHEDLIKWKDEYNLSKISQDPLDKYSVPPPTKNIFLDNLNLSFKKYFRGDDRKILHWGLDLSGGKTVQLELRDQNNKVVKNKDFVKQGVNELYNRVNKMGVSDVNIRTIDSNIVLDFPGAQNLSAADLVKASSMYFNIVNEKFSTENRELSDSVATFLQDVWNEAVVTNRKDIKSINYIAYKHLFGDELSPEREPLSETAKILFDNGLRIAHPDEEVSSNFDQTLSKIAILRETKEPEATPLLIVFNNYALEGSNLSNIKSSYDPSKGNFLSFEIKGTTISNNKKIKASKNLYNWTSHFSEKEITGTPLSKISNGRGWRMAIILNDSVISNPPLKDSLSTSAMISGNFTQREINKLSYDLKAGSLTFTPHILSEKNVSPEIGKTERKSGIIATLLSLLLIVVAIISYYRFAGVVAAIAVIFNLLIIWATLQNIQATLTLASIAGIILSVGMAVDANVLIFERIKEEFAVTGKLISSVFSGYKKAFSAILDSNVTTIIAALILLNFDSGPIKGFAVTLIIGIISSMFSTLFMTKYFFTRWVKKTSRKTLSMANLVKPSNFDFLKRAKYIFMLSGIVIIIGILTLNKSLLGMDFTGGFAINIELEEKNVKDFRPILKKAFLKKGASAKDFQIRELTTKNNLRVFLGTSMELKNKPFYNLPLATKGETTYPFENNPRIVWIVNALKAENLKIKNLTTLDQSWTSMSGQMSESMRNNAGIGLLLALIAVLIYITFRFEFKFAISAMLCLIHDVLITLATISFLHFLKVPVQLNLHTIAALMTIIGYSLNDTIIIFDRIREDSKLMRKSPLDVIVNHSLNKTLSRTSITSATTLLVLLVLLILGGSTIFSFALVMIMGVIYGTFSSLFIASPLMLFFQKKESKNFSKVVDSQN
jgi:SecD/SecF fusion protein